MNSHWNRAVLPIVLGICAALLACGGPKQMKFPEEIPGGWKLGLQEQMAAMNAAQELQVQGLQTWWRAQYTGPGYPAVFVYEMQSSGTAFELVQKHRSTPGTIVLNIDRFFITMQTSQGTLPELNRFAAAFEKAF